jgi:chromosome segregation ATPase
LIKETEYILEAEKEKLEGKQDKTQEQIDALVDVEITYKLVDGGKNGWKYVPILLADDKQRYEKLVNNSIANNYNEILELKQQIHLLKQEEIDFQLQIRERDRQITLLTGDFQHQKNTSGRKIASLQSENQGLKHKIDEYEQQIHAKDNKTNLLEKKHCTSSVQRTQTLDALEQEKQTIGQDKRSTVNEMERLKASYTTLEQLLKAKEDTIVLLNRENKMLSTLNQGNQQEANGMAETIRNLLKGKNNEIDLLKQNMEHALDKEKEKIKKLLKEIKQLKQNQHQQIVSFQEASSSSSTTVPEPSASNTGTNEDDTNNDFNYDTECGTEYSSSGDVSSEDGDHANDLNYDNDA